MTFQAYRKDHYIKLQAQILRLCWIGVILTTIAEIFIFNMNLKCGYIQDFLVTYVLIRMALPMSINFLSTIFFTIVYFNKNTSENFRNYTSVFTVLLLCTTVACVHLYYTFLLFALTLPLFLCTIFGSKPMLKAISLTSVFGYVIASFVYYFEHVENTPEHRIMSIFCLWMLFFAGVCISKALVTSQAKQIEFISDNCEQQLKLIEELKIEPMTGLYNKICLEECLKSYVRKHGLGLMNPTACIIDIDHFKNINDSYGHAEGDMVLLNLSSIIKKRMGGIRHAFRFGGEEFVVVWENADIVEVGETVRNIKRDFCETEYDFAPGENFSFSAGICGLVDGMDSAAWFKKMDDTLYRAKQDGRNRIYFYED